MDLNAKSRLIPTEYDSCGVYAQIDKKGAATRATVEAGIDALAALKHRAGFVRGEGDGCGLMMDIPRSLWKKWLADACVNPDLVDREEFFVAHLFLSRTQEVELEHRIEEVLSECHCEIVHWRPHHVEEKALGPMASVESPVFLQIGGLAPPLKSGQSTKQQLVHLIRQLEQLDAIHVASLDNQIVVYKVVGDGTTLYQYYLDLQDPLCTSPFVLVHTRYSTNTRTSFARVQPFRTLGHNGEINTITRFYEEAGMVGIPLDASGSDSQMVSGVVEHFTGQLGWSLFETAELLFPPILHEIKQLPDHLKDMYMHLRALWGPFAQGPAGVMFRANSQAVFSVDALGLRPMWMIETNDVYAFSSEQGIVPVDQWVCSPKALSPGEKVGLMWTASQPVQVYTYSELQEWVHTQMTTRFQFKGQSKSIRPPGPPLDYEPPKTFHDTKPWKIRAAAFGWREDDIKLLNTYLETGAEPIKSLGFDEPIAALSQGLRAVSDFIQETVAVVTNPAIDREREIEHFSTRVLLGKRPPLTGSANQPTRIELPSPLLLQADLVHSDLEMEGVRAVAYRKGTVCYEDALAALHDSTYGTVELLAHRRHGESVEQCLTRLRRDAVQAVQAGANIIVLDDRLQFVRGNYIDLFLMVSAVHKALLRPTPSQAGEHLRRRASLVLRSGSLRNLHDIMVAIGLGADAVNPYMIWELCGEKGSTQGLENTYTALCKGIEKVLSTLGIHELRGYERLFSAIGLHEEIAEVLGIPNFCGSNAVGYCFSDIERESLERQELHNIDDDKQLPRSRTFQLYPRIWKAAGQVADGTLEYESFFEKLHDFESETPINLRHTLRLRTAVSEGRTTFAGSDGQTNIQPSDVDTGIDIHAYPFLISSMSFGSQGEVAYRAYAEAASRLNILAMNGEGGEIKDLLNAYPQHRGRQVASGRFGVNAELCNGAYVLEIKIGQGAKPGEGGHLPGSKVTAQVASARNASPGIDLISPSNNHDIYSIEDLAQVISELRTINPDAKIAVKVPVVPNIGTIAVGIVKAGADIVELSGFDGGTGAARAHAIRHVGLPSDIGIKLVHDALCEAGLRNCVEIWADGGMKSGMDVMKAILMGANRVGFGTMAMVAIGCTSCRACHKDTCHVGIATQMTDLAEALHKGLKQFVPQEFNLAVERLTSWFTAVGEHVRHLTASLGARRTQDLVGRSDLLEQVACFDSVDLTSISTVNDAYRGYGAYLEFRQFAVDEPTELLHSAIAVGADDGVMPSSTSFPEAPDGTGVYGVSGSSSNVGAGSKRNSGERIRAVQRLVGTWESGDRVRDHKTGEPAATLHYASPVGNGLAAYTVAGVHSTILGGAQDGVGKGAYGGRTVVLKHRLPNGRWVGGSVGKGLAYGAQHGLFIVQGNADARAGIRLSGADVVIGGEILQPLRDDLGFIGCRSNIAGFAFEYMTSGRAVILGDPGPWICSGMTGGSVYVKLSPGYRFTEAALKRRIAKGAKVDVRLLDGEGISDVVGLLLAYQRELRKSGQRDEARKLLPLLRHPAEHFVMIRPGAGITDQDIATE